MKVSTISSTIYEYEFEHDFISELFINKLLVNLYIYYFHCINLRTKKIVRDFYLKYLIIFYCIKSHTIFLKIIQICKNKIDLKIKLI
jgi:hypothetical protein